LFKNKDKSNFAYYVLLGVVNLYENKTMKEIDNEKVQDSILKPPSEHLN